MVTLPAGKCRRLYGVIIDLTDTDLNVIACF